MKMKKMTYRGRKTTCGYCDFCDTWKPVMELETMMHKGQKKHRCIKCTCKADPAFGRMKINCLGHVKSL